MTTQTTFRPPRKRIMAAPIVLERGKKGGKKSRKPRLRDADQSERYLYRAAERTVDAADRGLRRYDRARKKSARRERDGAMIDLFPNMARGAVATTARLAPVPLDLARASTPRSVRRWTRQSVRATARLIDGS